MKSIELIVFDFDGTLVDSGNDLVASVNYTLTAMEIPSLEKEIIIGFIGDGVKKLVERSLGSKYADRLDEALGIFRKHYGEHLLDSTTLYPGVIEILEFFHASKKIIITNKMYEFTVEIAKTLNIMKYFDSIVGMNSTPYRKPDPRLLKPLMEKFSTESRRVVVVGDGVNDIMLARNSGALSCALLNGLTDRARLLALQPDYTCEEISALRHIFS